MVVHGVDGSGFSCVRRCGRGCWPLTGSSCWPLSLSMVCSTRVFDDVGTSAGRGVGCRVSCPRPLPWRYPSGFAGVSFATVLGLGVWWSVRGSCVAVVGVDGVGYKRVRGCGRGCWPRCGWLRWSWLVLMARAMCVFERVRGCGRVCWPSSRSPGCLLADDFCVFEGVAALSGRRLGRLCRLGCLLVDDFCGTGVGLSSVRGCGRCCWPSSRSPRCLRVVASGVGEASLGGVRLRSRLWVVGVTRKDV